MRDLDGSPILTIQEAAAFLSLHPQTVWRMCHSGKLPGAFRIGGTGRWRIKKDILERDIKTRTDVVK